MRMLRGWIGMGMAALAVALGAGPAGAHPHVWADVRMEVVFDEAGRLAGVRQSWRLDQTFTQIEVMPYVDLDRNGVLNDAEIEDAKANSFVFVRFNRYFTRIIVDDVLAGFARSGPIEIGFADGLFTVSFELRLDQPVAVRDAASIDVFDGDIYYSLDFPRIVAPGEPITAAAPIAADAIAASGTPAGCSVGRRAPETLDPMAVALLTRLGLITNNDAAAGFPARAVVVCRPAGAA